MAVVDNVTRIEQTNPKLEVVRALLTGASSTFVSDFGTIQGVIVVAEGTNGATFTWTGSTVTITGTNNDAVTIMVWGY